MNKLASAPYARSASPGSRVGVFIIASPACWVARTGREPGFTSSRVPRQGSSPASFRLETASPWKRRSKGLSRMTGNCHVRFWEGWPPRNGGWLLG